VKIIDWGLARCLGIPGDTSQSDPASIEELDREKGQLIGTADYIAPEQAQDPTLVDTRADVYSLGCTLYYLLTGQVVFPAPSLMQKLLQHQEAEPPSVRRLRPDVPEELDGIIRKMLAKAPLDRFQIPLLVVAPLRRFCGGPAGARPSANGTAYRPSSSGALAPLTGLNLPRPATATQLPRPDSKVELDRPV
jgi:serine/threonine-protein kinase